MNRALRMPRPIAAGLVAMALWALAWVLPATGLGQAPGTAAPGAGAGDIDLLKAMAFDRITLADNTVFTIEPVSPRPLPTYDPAKDDKPKGEAAKAKRAAQSKQAKAEAKAREEALVEISIHLVEGEQRDFKVKRANIKKVEYFEDMLIAEAERLMIGHDYAKAFEHLLLARSRNPAWKGLEEAVDRLLFEEGSWALVENNRERGVRLLRELSARKPNYEGLAAKLAQAYGGRIGEAFDKGAYRYARMILHDLESISPDNPLVKESRERFIAKAKELGDAAQKQSGPAKLDGLTEVLRIWPTLENAAERYTEAFTALPTLDVAVVDWPRPIGPWILSPAADRVARLIYLPILERDDEAAIHGKLPNQLAAGMEVGDIGKRLEVMLRPGATWSDGSRPASAIDVVRALADRAQPRSPGYNARWADVLERVEATDVNQVTIRLARPFLKPESWLLGPVGPAHAAWDGRVPTGDGHRKPIGDGPFTWEAETPAWAAYRLAKPPESPGSLRVQRVREVRLPRGSAAMAAFIRGEVTLVEHVPQERVADLRENPEFRVGNYSRPTMHRIALDGRNPALRNRSLRRAISYAIDRKTLLEETLLRRPIDNANLPADGPFGTDSYANAPDVRPLTYDPLLARMLIAGAKRELAGNLPKLTFEYPATPEAVIMGPKIVEALRGVGLEIDAFERPESELEESLRAGRRFDLAYRASRVVEPVWEAGPLLCPGYDSPASTQGLAAMSSPRMMQLLLQLEQAPEWNSAKALVTQIDRECRDELPIVPLWQLQDHYAWRTRLKGPADTADNLYQGIEKWEIDPWFAKDPW